jgi:hypothetical protein
MLHIWVRHRKTLEDAARIWLEAHGKSVWNARYRRYEVYTGKEILFWFWIQENKVIMIASCIDE